MFKSYNKKIGKLDESLGRKAIGPVKWQPIAQNEVHCLLDSVFFTALFHRRNYNDLQRGKAKERYESTWSACPFGRGQ